MSRRSSPLVCLLDDDGEMSDCGDEKFGDAVGSMVVVCCSGAVMCSFLCIAELRRRSRMVSDVIFSVVVMLSVPRTPAEVIFAVGVQWSWCAFPR